MTTLSSLSKTKRQENVRTVGRQFQSIVITISITAFLFGGIVWRLAYLQLEQGEINQAKAEDNRIRLVPKPPVRANIFDRKGKVLATTRLSHSAYVWPKAQKQGNWSQIKQILAQILNLPPEEIQQKVEQAGFNYPSLIPIARSLTPTQITAIEEYRPQLKWVEVDIDRVRYYPNGKTAAHVLGYTGEINQEELNAKKKDGYRLGDVIGKMGVEESFESKLRGAWGGLKLEVDGSGKVLRFLGEKPPKSGKDITLTIDLEVQKAAETALGKQKGAIIALDPNNGAVIAIASYPSFDPNIFSTRITPEIWQQLQSQGNPFLNMALRGFPPASTFKVVTDTAGMESGKFPPQTVLGTYAGINIGGTYFREWNHAGFGSMGYVGALSWSSNTFHAQIGRGVGGEALIKWARNYGYGQKTGIELQGETAGLIADDAWKRLNFNDWGWTVGDTVNMSIGQGFTLATPVQVAVMFSAIANGGYRVQPHLLETDNQTKQAQRINLNLKPSTISTLRNGLRAVVTSGTGTRLNVPEIPSAAGKSGTAEAPPGESHAWFGAYAPFDQPEIVVVAFAEHSGGGGGSVAGPMVRQVMEVYFKRKVANK
ncbi:penicillin-binding protein 2 [Stanieria cyanosphaera PCC 7437]|uniref:Penicillin-binding protein 2 n=1 Tax=Stanieria cyanosphaera (strain ATCC 29371 / PCC 7437) TaxID=111780 RepID=K9XVS2_STAC7|nr:penicillin-binding protein 2 [Stanieria cyanosphaera]AFZ35772.1 penicillin-binding protein 2 [Stanieria cyanosphaera PCC 7437]